jgi:cytochrome c oxidase assembly factor CtaG
VWQAVCFAAGLSTVGIALLSPLDHLAEELFSGHMVQHLLLTVVAPPLLVVSAPTTALVSALPRGGRRRVVAALKGQRWLTVLWTSITTPAFACALHGVALWLWHTPALYTTALAHPVAHALEHLSFLGTATLLWWSIVHPRRSRREAYGAGILTLFITMLQSGALGALITLSRRVWYPIQARDVSAFGLTPLQDQQLAGLLMWVPGGLFYLAAMGVVFVAFMRTMRRQTAVPAVEQGHSERRPEHLLLPPAFPIQRENSWNRQ